MDILVLIECIFLVLVLLHLFGFVTLKIYEKRKKELYQKMLKRLVLLENFQLTKAVEHAKTYKIMADYHQGVLKLKKIQQIALRAMLLNTENR